ncbi:peptidase m61 domain-containing [Fusarium albosuccineum]|uniref:Peptidase m61 domain-containing n=1 Tax=Fusarium albosuccineum TaxID=1237068 RepID=A0A8H4P7B8_9HYPO|nr:peptidase m61 domain-containing [Fusarium albosuccineum]
MSPDSLSSVYAYRRCCPAISSILDFSGPTPFAAKVYLAKNQFGEAFHVLICRLILEHSPGTVVGVEFEEDPGQFEQLFKWYKLDPLPGRTSEFSRGSKAIATQVIAAAFRSFNSGMKTIFNQDQLFLAIREHLSQPLQPIQQVPLSISIPYPNPSETAQKYLNEYFRIANTRLPDKSEAGRLAVIHIRGNPATPIGLVMDNENLKYVASSIKWANKACEAAGDKMIRFKHVMIYGDFTWDRGREMADALSRDIGDGVKILFLTPPWKNDGDDKKIESGGKKKIRDENKKMKEEIHRLWEKFCKYESDFVPIQAKILGIWTTLCEQYHPNICVIGFRSGFVESAGFIGIPIFYLNNERSKNAQGNPGISASDVRSPRRKPGQGTSSLRNTKKRAKDAGDRLWKVVENPKDDRLREVSDVLNTFIPVEALKKMGPNQTARVEEGYEDELMGALFIFMCCEFNPPRESDPWQSGLHDCAVPAWTARVTMIHDTCEARGHSPGPESDKCNDQAHFRQWREHWQTGQEWLRRRYMFAVKVKQQETKPELELSRWDGINLRIWEASWRENEQSQSLEITPEFTHSKLTSISISLKVADIRVNAGEPIYWLGNPSICRTTMVAANDDCGPLILPANRDKNESFLWFADRETSGPIYTQLEVRPFHAKVPRSDANDCKWEDSGFRVHGRQLLPELHDRLKCTGWHKIKIEWNLSRAPKGTRAVWQAELLEEPTRATYTWNNYNNDASGAIEKAGSTWTLLDAIYECRVA